MSENQENSLDSNPSSQNNEASAMIPGLYSDSKLHDSSMEVSVDHNIERAMKVLKRKLIKEGLFKELKSRRFYEKPSEKKKRKLKETLKKIRKDNSRAKKNQFF